MDDVRALNGVSFGFDMSKQASPCMHKYLSLEGSTTYFFEKLSNARVDVEVLRQRLVSDTSGRVLQRSSRLFIVQRERTIVVANSQVYIDRIDSKYREALLACDQGIGKILDPFNTGCLQKRDLGFEYVEPPQELNTISTWALCRRFELLFDGSVCASIEETVCNLSLARAL